MGVLKRTSFWISLLIVFATIVLAIGRVLNLYGLGFFVGPFRASHWMSIVGSAYIGVATLAFILVKRRFKKRYKILVNFHVIGNLSAFLLVTVHFVSQVTRSIANYPELGVGLALYVVMLLLVISGFPYRFHFIHRLNIDTNRLVHVGVALSFYILIGIHVLHGINIL